MSQSNEPASAGPREFFGGRLNLEQQRKRAKELLELVRDDDPQARGRVEAHHSNADPDAFQLADAQLVVARENGFLSWPRMKAHIERLRFDRLRIEAGKPDIPDTPATTHIRCGEDIRHSLEVGGFKGRFLEFSDPYCQGPVPRVPKAEFISRRAAFIASGYGRDQAEAEKGLQEQYKAVDSLGEGAPVVLWFEHDSYDQLILAYLLSVFHRMEKRPDLQMICVGQVPGVRDFVGLGQLHPEVLLWLWEYERHEVTEAQLALGARVWDAITDADPNALAAIAANGTPELPLMAAALRRHLRELPHPKTGLGLTQHLSLTILDDMGDMSAGQIFQILMSRREPLPYLGDLMFWHVLTDLAKSTDPVILMDPETAGQPWPKRVFSLRDSGRRVLAGEEDYVAIQRGSRWVGGVEIRPGRSAWRWDEDAGEVRRA
ncbi:DUF1835 domain-containing protein [Nisaea acidiphila]|uniref:DUF1835 domain-containing protein n=1 Tax=Nisaea acidiphila TaxID=1862145 RepID=A0A9J7AUH5_9PROT|nr:DUF1835 domain-containing protein [Nisaea acidiphila]UUX50992.1 DUF1835 domain-containing protein [Nisaea acidiphila]